MSYQGVFVIHRTQPGRRDEVREVWMEHMASAVESNEDHLAYVYCFDDADEDVVFAFQLYRSADAAAAFLERPSYTRYLEAVEPLLAGPPEVRMATPMWSKGLIGG